MHFAGAGQRARAAAPLPCSSSVTPSTALTDDLPPGAPEGRGHIDDVDIPGMLYFLNNRGLLTYLR